MTEPKQLELDFSDGVETWFGRQRKDIPDFTGISSSAVGYTASSYDPPYYQPSRPLWKKLLLTPFTTLYNAALFIVCIIALSAWLLMKLVPILLRILCMPFILIGWICCAICRGMSEVVRDLWDSSKRII